ncbi:MAG: hypothetical protein E6772_16070 [Dysgonomonas sp.]|nr:hypothetical protein [Dysgonomonas sp.]
MRRSNFWKKAVLGLTTLSIMSFAACSDDDDNGGESNSKVYVPTEMSVSDETLVMKYDNSLRLTNIDAKSTASNSESYIYSYAFFYDSDGKLIKMKDEYKDSEEHSIDEYEYSYKNDSIFRFYLGDEGKTLESTYIVDSKGFVKERITARHNDTLIFNYDAVGNLIKTEKSNDEWSYEYGIDFEYDKTTGISKNINMPHWLAYDMFDRDDIYFFLLSKANNITKMTSEGHGQNYVDQFNYKLNAEGYPETATWNDWESESTTYTFKYSAK